MTWLRILAEPEMGFYDRADERDAGDLTDLSWPRLTGTSAFRRSLSPGGEAPNVTVTLDNGDGELTELLLGDPPLGYKCEIGEGDELIATGRLTRVAGAALLELSVEGGL